MHHFLRRDYGTFQLFSGNSGQQTAGLVERTVAYLSDVLFTQGLGVVLPLAAVGVCVSASMPLFLSGKGIRGGQSSRRRGAAVLAKGSRGKKARVAEAGADDSETVGQSPDATTELTEGRANIASVLIATLCFYFLVFHSLSNLPLDNPLLYGVHQRFWMQPSVIMFAFGGIGFNAAMAKASSFLGKQYPPAALAVSRVFLVLSLLLCAGQVQKWYSHSDQSDAYYFRDYAKALVSPLPPSSILIINYDMQWCVILIQSIAELLF